MSKRVKIRIITSTVGSPFGAVLYMIIVCAEASERCYCKLNDYPAAALCQQVLPARFQQCLCLYSYKFFYRAVGCVKSACILDPINPAADSYHNILAAYDFCRCAFKSDIVSFNAVNNDERNGAGSFTPEQSKTMFSGACDLDAASAYRTNVRPGRRRNIDMFCIEQSIDLKLSRTLESFSFNIAIACRTAAGNGYLPAMNTAAYNDAATSAQRIRLKRALECGAAGTADGLSCFRALALKAARCRKRLAYDIALYAQ